MIIITKHAHERFLERFPDVRVCLTERVEAALPFGGQQGDEEFRIDAEHNMVFVLVKHKNDLVLKTILTQDQALANLAVKSDIYKGWRDQPAIAPRSPIILEEIKTNQNLVENQLKELAQKDVVAFNYYCPPLAEKKRLSKQMRDELGYTIHALDKYYWPEVFRLIYEYNAANRSVEN